MIYLHIGNGKAGSTTIQWFLENNRSVLEANSIALPDVGINKLAQVLASPGIEDAKLNDTLFKFRSAVEKTPAKAFVFSCEFFFTVFRRRALEFLHAATSKQAVKVIIYLREYPGWIVSSYNQTMKHGKIIADFDVYFDHKLKITSAIPTIQAWADVFGKENLHIRSIDAPSLTGGKLTVDFATAIGVDGLRELQLDVATKNASEDWYTAELRRALAGELKHLPVDDRSKEFIELNRWIRRLMPTAPKSSEVRRVQYLTRRQWRLARDLYNSDVQKIVAEFPAAVVAELHCGEPQERVFLPAFEHIPFKIRDSLASAIGRAKEKKLLPEEEAKIFEKIFMKH